MVEWITDSMDMSLSKVQQLVIDKEAGMLQSIGLQRVRHNLVAEQQQKLNTKKRLPNETV